MPDLESRENPYNVTQASRIYFLPNLMTGASAGEIIAEVETDKAILEVEAPAAGRLIRPARVGRAEFVVVGFDARQSCLRLRADKNDSVAKIICRLCQRILIAHARPAAVLAVIAQPAFLRFAAQFCASQPGE